MRIILPLLFCLISPLLFSQNTQITGVVKDNKTGESLVGVNVVSGNKKGTSTDDKGRFALKLKEGDHRITFSYIGYEKEIITLRLKRDETRVVNINLRPQTSILDEVVVSAGRYEQKRTDVSVSMELIKPEFIYKNNTTSLETVIQKIPGVMVTDEQVSIRGGSGYSYGVGSRVLLLVDGLPLMTGASGEAKWEFIPTENIKQVEVIKGASSVLYGSSALNGVINIRTSTPGNIPQTKLISSAGWYGNPKRPEIKWWGNKIQNFENIRMVHSRKIGNLDLTLGMGGFGDEGYKQDEHNNKYSGYINTKFHFKKMEGLTAGVNINYLNRNGELFLLWKDGDSGVYQPSNAFIQNYNVNRLSLDPYLEYLGKNNIKHSFRNRFYRIDNQNNTGQNNTDYLIYSEYQVQKYFESTTWTSGISGTYVESVAELFGNKGHQATNAALFSQLDKKIGNFSFSAGARWEYNTLDGKDDKGIPIFRSGINYQAAEYSFFRASYGQGFRYPSIAEKYTVTQVGDLKIFPNDTLLPERGWNAEVGFIQGYKVGKLSGLLDIALFWTQYSNMIEFTFGQHYPVWINPKMLYLDTFLKYTGFKAYNISTARVKGLDISVNGKFKNNDWVINYMGGYTFTDPVELNFDSALTTNSTTENVLKYRFYHNFKFDLDIAYKQFSVGLNADYHSFVVNIDKAFEDSIRLPNGFPVAAILPGLQTYREEHNKGDIVLDLRVGYKISENQDILFLVRNILNREYILRPGDVQPPRNFAFQYMLKF